MTPIALIAYNRPDHLRRTLDALSKNEGASETDLFIFSDGPKSDSDELLVNEVRDIRPEGFRSVSRINNIVNVGSSDTVISAVSYVLAMYDSVIVVEDDLVTSRNFLTYMNCCLVLFKDRKDISSIAGYNPIRSTIYCTNDLYLSPRPCSWGWATWNDRWYKFDPYNQKITKEDKKGFNLGGDDLYRMYKQIDIWDVKWAFHNYKLSLYTVYPGISKVMNIGADGSGVHVGKTNRYDTVLDPRKGFSYSNKDLQPSVLALERFRAFYHHSLFKRFKLLIYDICFRPLLR